MRHGAPRARCENQADEVGARRGRGERRVARAHAAYLDEAARRTRRMQRCAAPLELGDKGALVRGAHERLADEHGVHALRCVRLDVSAPGDAAQRDEDRAALECGLREPRRRAHVDVEAVQVAVVDADHARRKHERALHLGGRVHLDERVHAEPHAVVVQAAERGVVQHCDDQQHRVRAREARLGNLVLVEHKVLAQDGRALRQALDGAARQREVLERAAEPRRLRQHANHTRAAARVRQRLLGRVRVRRNVALAWARALHFGHDARRARSRMQQQTRREADLRRVELQRKRALEVCERAARLCASVGDVDAALLVDALQDAWLRRDRRGQRRRREAGRLDARAGVLRPCAAAPAQELGHHAAAALAHDALWVVLHALHRVFAVAHAHDDARVDARGLDEHGRERRDARAEAVVASAHERRRSVHARKQAAAVVRDRRRLAVEDFAGELDDAPVRGDHALHAHADAEDRDAPDEALNARARYARVTQRVARPRADDEAHRVERLDLLERHAVVAEDDEVRALLDKQLHDIVRKAVVVVNHHRHAAARAARACDAGAPVFLVHGAVSVVAHVT